MFAGPAFEYVWLPFLALAVGDKFEMLGAVEPWQTRSPLRSAIEDVERPMLRSLLWGRELPADDPG